MNENHFTGHGQLPTTDEVMGAIGDHQTAFDVTLDKYTQGLEPMESWAEEDLVRVRNAIDVELQERRGEEVNGNR